MGRPETRLRRVQECCRAYDHSTLSWVHWTLPSSVIWTTVLLMLSSKIISRISIGIRSRVADSRLCVIIACGQMIGILKNWNTGSKRAKPLDIYTMTNILPHIGSHEDVVLWFWIGVVYDESSRRPQSTGSGCGDRNYLLACYAQRLFMWLADVEYGKLDSTLFGR